LGNKQKGINQMKCDQIAYAVNSDEASAKVKALLGLASAPWVVDRVTAMCTVWGKENCINIAKLEFYDWQGMQFEIIRYMRGENWLKAEQGEIFQSHVGYHLDPGEAFPEMPGCPLAQEARTMAHTCDYLTLGAAAGRKYHYRIHLVGPHTYMKFIRRIDV
jgi:hypothetical protein